MERHRLTDDLLELRKGDTLVTESLCCEEETSLTFQSIVPEERLVDSHEVLWCGEFLDQDGDLVVIEALEEPPAPELSNTPLQQIQYEWDEIVGACPVHVLRRKERWEK